MGTSTEPIKDLFILVQLQNGEIRQAIVPDAAKKIIENVLDVYGPLKISDELMDGLYIKGADR